MLNKQNKFVCQYSKLVLPERMFVNLASSKTKCGCFADVNCAIAYLQAKVPKGWTARVKRLHTLYQRDHIEPATLPWSLEHPQRVPNIPACTQSVEEYRQQRAEKIGCVSSAPVLPPPPLPPPPPIYGKKRKHSSSWLDDEDRANEADMVVVAAQCGATEAQPLTARRFKLTILDARGKQRVFMTDNWRREAEAQLGFKLEHAFPAFVSISGKAWTVHPQLECDPKHVSASEIILKVECRD